MTACVNFSLVLFYLHLSHTLSLCPLSFCSAISSSQLLLFASRHLISPHVPFNLSLCSASISFSLNCLPKSHHLCLRVRGTICLRVCSHPDVLVTAVWCDVVAAATVCLFTSHSHLEIISDAFAWGGSHTRTHIHTHWGTQTQTHRHKHTYMLFLLSVPLSAFLSRSSPQRQAALVADSCRGGLLSQLFDKVLSLC